MLPSRQTFDKKTAKSSVFFKRENSPEVEKRLLPTQIIPVEAAVTNPEILKANRTTRRNESKLLYELSANKRTSSRSPSLGRGSVIKTSTGDSGKKVSSTTPPLSLLLPGVGSAIKPSVSGLSTVGVVEPSLSVPTLAPVLLLADLIVPAASAGSVGVVDAESAESDESSETDSESENSILDSDSDMAEGGGSSFLPPPFTGEGSEDAERFLALLKRYISFKGNDEETKKVDLFMLRLAGSAFSWASSLGADQIDTFAHLSTAFETRYLPKDMMKFRFAKEIYDNKQGKTQSVDDYILKLKKQGTLAGLNETAQVFAALNGMLPHIVDYVIDHGYATIDELVKNARTAELKRTVSPLTENDDHVSNKLGAMESKLDGFMSEMRRGRTLARLADDNGSGNEQRRVSFGRAEARSISPAIERGRSPVETNRFQQQQQQPRPFQSFGQGRGGFNQTRGRGNFTPRFQRDQPNRQYGAASSSDKPQQGGATQPQNQVCFRCGRLGGHVNPLFCPMLDKTCHSCGRVGHGYRQCKGGSQQNRQF